MIDKQRDGHAAEEPPIRIDRDAAEAQRIVGEIIGQRPSPRSTGRGAGAEELRTMLRMVAWIGVALGLILLGLLVLLVATCFRVFESIGPGAPM